MTLIILITLILLLFGGGFCLRRRSSYRAYSGAGMRLGGLLLTGTLQF